MLDRRDFDEWWAREQARASTPLDPSDRYWAEAGFMAAGRLLAQAMRTQKQAERSRAPSLLQGVPRGR